MAKITELAIGSQARTAVAHTVSRHPDLNRASMGFAVFGTRAPFNILVSPDSGTIARRFGVGRKVVLGLLLPLIVPGVVLSLQLEGRFFILDISLSDAEIGSDAPFV